MQDDFDRNFPSSEIDLLGVNEFGEESANELATAISDVPWLQDVDANQNDVSDVWYDRWEITWRDVVILDAANELAGVYNLTTYNLNEPANYDALRQMIVDVATADRVSEGAWQNRVEPLDVSGDGFVVPNDVLRIINRLNDEGAGELPMTDGPISAYYDVTGDNYVSPLDALRVIRHLNGFNIAEAGEPDDELDLSTVVMALSPVEATSEPVATEVPSNDAVESAPRPEKTPAVGPVTAATAFDLYYATLEAVEDPAADDDIPLSLI